MGSINEIAGLSEQVKMEVRHFMDIAMGKVLSPQKISSPKIENDRPVTTATLSTSAKARTEILIDKKGNDRSDKDKNNKNERGDKTAAKTQGPARQNNTNEKENTHQRAVKAINQERAIVSYEMTLAKANVQKRAGAHILLENGLLEGVLKIPGAKAKAAHEFDAIAKKAGAGGKTSNAEMPKKVAGIAKRAEDERHELVSEGKKEGLSHHGLNDLRKGFDKNPAPNMGKDKLQVLQHIAEILANSNVGISPAAGAALALYRNANRSNDKGNPAPSR